MGFSRQEYWSGLPCPPPGNVPYPETEPRSPVLQADSLLTELWRNPPLFIMYILIIFIVCFLFLPLGSKCHKDTFVHYGLRVHARACTHTHKLFRFQERLSPHWSSFFPSFLPSFLSSFSLPQVTQKVSDWPEEYEPQFPQFFALATILK